MNRDKTGEWRSRVAAPAICQ